MPLFSEALPASNKNKPSKRNTEAFYRWEGDTLVLNILGRPSAKRDEIGRVIGHQLEVSVKAIPRMGGATAYMVRFLAEVFDVPKSAIEVVFGERNVNKQVKIHAPKNLPAP
ncbi:MAG: hypothetical protein COW45_02560, partial [Gallionellales bacterium CG17_big_fil_post_rev_8_21_14_2_50_54_146]